MTHGFGIVGCGMISSFHGRAIAEVRGAKLVACFDTREPAAEKFAAENGCKAYTDLEAMLADSKVSIVTIATPSGAHMEPAVAAARAGKHVIIEKALGITLKKSDPSIDECAKGKGEGGAIFPARVYGSGVELERAI